MCTYTLEDSGLSVLNPKETVSQSNVLRVCTACWVQTFNRDSFYTQMACVWKQISSYHVDDRRKNELLYQAKKIRAVIYRYVGLMMWAQGSLDSLNFCLFHAVCIVLKVLIFFLYWNVVCKLGLWDVSEGSEPLGKNACFTCEDQLCLL